ncbi:MAG: isopentenyl transferase family protein, partial [Pseudomonadota bacterium]
MAQLVVIAGPTATGKTAHALDLAARHDGTIINADASQIYNELRILTARPTDDDMAAAPHRLFGVATATDIWSAADWAKRATVEVEAAMAAGRLPILVGGTGFYLNALLNGIADIPPIPDDIRAAVRTMPLSDLRHRLVHEDPEMAERLRPSDPQRQARA